MKKPAPSRMTDKPKLRRLLQLNQPSIVFKIDDAPAPTGKRQAPAIEAALAICRALPLGELLTAAAIAARLPQSADFIRNAFIRAEWHGCRVREGRRYLYGSPDTITAYAQAHGL